MPVPDDVGTYFAPPVGGETIEDIGGSQMISGNTLADSMVDVSGKTQKKRYVISCECHIEPCCGVVGGREVDEIRLGCVPHHILNRGANSHSTVSSREQRFTFGATEVARGR